MAYLKKCLFNWQQKKEPKEMTERVPLGLVWLEKLFLDVCVL